jgi:glycosyltransferase involved in cell wall biosynthesis
MDGAASMTAISVVMGVYNGAQTLAATLDSILAQTERDFECIVVDDGSTDDTPRILDDYAGRDTRIRIIRQANAGLTRALITGCANARGTYIARHDAGDLSHTWRFEKQRAVLDAHADVVFVSCATSYAGPNLEPMFLAPGTGAAREPENVLDIHDPRAMTAGPTHHGSVMFRRDAYLRVGGYRAAFYYGQDFDLWYRFAEIGKFQATDEILYTARITTDSISGAARKRQVAIGKLSREALIARQSGRSDADIVARAAMITRAPRSAFRRRANGLYFIGEALRRKGDPRARGYLRQSVESWPLSIRTWIRFLQSLRLKPPPEPTDD